MQHAVEIKANVKGEVQRSLDALGDPPSNSTRSVWFVEVRQAVQANRLELFPQSVILRVRSGDDDDDDTTAKVRPAQANNLVGDWSRDIDEDGFEYRIEGDWAGDNHVLAASAETSHEPGALADIVKAKRFDVLFTPRQREFVLAAAHVDIDTDSLFALGPITSQKWKKLKFGGVSGVNAERWTVAGLDFLEFSIKVDPEGRSAAQHQENAEHAQQDLLRAIEKVGIELSDSKDSKTKQVLTELTKSH